MAPRSTLDRSFPTLKYVAAPFRWVARDRRRRRSAPLVLLAALAAPFRWSFGSRRRVLSAAAILVGMIAAPVVWWFVQLMGLPDIGEPFDVEAFRAFTIPEDRNAFVLYRRAAVRLEPVDRTIAASYLNSQVRWSKTDPVLRRWLEENRAAMELYLRGTERLDALLPTPRDDPGPYQTVGALGDFLVLSLLEASRLEEQGDLTGAWDWYRAALRATYHMGLRGTADVRGIARSWHGRLRRRLGEWAGDPRTTPSLLRRALDDVLACGDLTPSDSFTLKREYAWDESPLSGPDNPGRRKLIMRLRRRFGSLVPNLDPDRVRVLVDAWRYWRREPERSGRVLRLALANWLAYYDRPPGRRPAPVPGVYGLSDFYAFGPEAPAGARALSPQALDRWQDTTIDAKELPRHWDLRALGRGERANHRALVVLLASELYRRDHGAAPPSDEALVGPYLKELSDDGLGDGVAPAGPAAAKPPAASRSTGRE